LEVIRVFRSTDFAHGRAFFDPQAVARHGKAEREINEGDEKVGFDLEGTPIGIRVERQAQGTRQLIQRNNGHQGGVFEQAYEGVIIPIEFERWVLINNVKHNELENIYVNIPQGIDDNEIIVLENKGHILNENVKGDIKIVIGVENSSEFKRSGLDIIYKKKITLKESLCGFSFEIKHLNGKQLCLNNNVNRTIIKPMFRKVIPKMGMVRDNDTIGNLIIEFDIDYPDSFSEEQMEALSKIL
jgi:hypothetical protein